MSVLPWIQNDQWVRLSLGSSRDPGPCTPSLQRSFLFLSSSARTKGRPFLLLSSTSTSQQYLIGLLLLLVFVCLSTLHTTPLGTNNEMVCLIAPRLHLHIFMML